MSLGETAEVLGAIDDLVARGRPGAVATIVSVEGSTYRRPGARLLVPGEGAAVGNLSGGCLEGEVEGVAREVMADGRARLRLYDLTADDEIVWGWGLGCNGAIEVLVEPAHTAAVGARALSRAMSGGTRVAVATVLSSGIEGVQVGARALVGEGGGAPRDLGDAAVFDLAGPAITTALAGEAMTTKLIESPAGDLRVFVEVFEPPLRLVVCGAGHDAVPLVRHAASLGWNVEVVDDRDSFLSAERFPGASGFVRAEPGDAASAAGVDARTYVVVMSHNYLRDRDYLRCLLGTSVAYVGMLGPRARAERILNDLGAGGIHASPEDLDKIHGPAGLDLGAEDPEEIACSVVAEILALSRRHRGGFLRDRPGPIHDASSVAPAARGGQRPC